MTATITSVDSSSALRVVLPLSAVTAASPVTATRSPSRARLAAGATARRTAGTARVSTLVTLSWGEDTATVNSAASPSADRCTTPGDPSPPAGRRGCRPRRGPPSPLSGHPVSSRLAGRIRQWPAG